MPVTKKFIQEVTQITAANLNKTGFYNLVAREQDTPDMTLAISSGVANINGTVVKYAGGNTGTFTAPSTNPRIDLVTLTSAGAIAIVTGVEAASPSAPTYPPDRIVICEVYLRTTATSIKQESDGTNGYIYADGRPFTVESDASLFFGTGADGDVTIASGTTTLASDMNYYNLTIASGATLKTAGYRVNVRGRLLNNGTIHNDGGAGGNATTNPPTVGTAGAAASGGTLTAGTAGGAGGLGHGVNSYYLAGSGGGGGGTGGVVYIGAYEIVNNGTIRSNGGIGGNGSDGIGNVNVTSTKGNGVNGTAKTALGNNGVAGGAGGAITGGSPVSGGTGGTAGTTTSETVAYNTSLTTNTNLTAGSTDTYTKFLIWKITASTNGDALSVCAGSGGGGGGAAANGGSAGAGGGGGGGGGNGGNIFLVYYSYPTAGTVTASGGAGGNGGAKIGTDGQVGVTGTTGNAGKIYKLSVTA